MSIGNVRDTSLDVLIDANDKPIPGLTPIYDIFSLLIYIGWREMLPMILYEKNPHVSSLGSNDDK